MINWKDKNGQEYVSANSNENTCLLFNPGYQTAGTLLHSNGDYYLNATSCSQRGSCAGGCRCNDCPQQFGTNKDMDTAGQKLEFLKAMAHKAAAGAAHYAQKGAEHAAAAIEKAHEKGKQVLAAAEHAAKAFHEKHAELQSANGDPTNIVRQQLDKVRRDEQRVLQDLTEVDSNKLTDEERARFAEAQDLFRKAVAVLAPLAGAG